MNHLLRQAITRWSIRALAIAGYFLFVGFVMGGMIQLSPVISQSFAPPTTHHGTITNRFMSVESGTTAYHLLINESGVIVDVRTDATTWYTSAKVGEEYTWAAKDALETAPIAVGIVLIGIGTFGGIWWDWVVRYLWPEKQRERSKMEPGV